MTIPDPTNPSPEEVSFAPAAGESRGRRAGRAAAWVAVGALGATVLTGVALASTHSVGSQNNEITAVTAASSTNPEAPGAPGMPGGDMGRGGPGGPMDGFGAGRDLLHGDLVVKDGTATKNVLVQSGSVTAASATSLTVKSSDGFVATWTLNSSTTVRAFLAKGKNATVTDLKIGDQVMVAGAKISDTSGTATLVHVKPTDAQLKALAKTFRQFGRHDGRGRPGMRMPMPSTTTSPTGA